jgi:hypothetical protein
MCAESEQIYDRFDHLRRALFWDSDTVVMIVTVRPFTLYADDSGKKNTRVVVVGGYVGEASSWEHLQESWKRKVHSRGLKEFKRSAFNIHAPGAKDFLEQLRNLIHGYASFGFACGIDSDAWRSLHREYASELYHLTPYSICARTCIGLARQWCANEDIKSDHMAHIFDCGSQDAGELIELLKIDRSRDARKVVSSVSSACSHDIAGLQAADYLAWAIRKQYLVDPDAEDLSAAIPEVRAILKHSEEGRERIPRFSFFWEKDLKKLYRDVKVMLRKDVPPEVWEMKKPIRLKWPATKP